MALTYNSQFETELRKIVEDERQRVRDELEGAEAVKDYAAYRERIGYLRALKDVGDWCAETETKLSKR